MKIWREAEIMKATISRCKSPENKFWAKSGHWSRKIDKLYTVEDNTSIKNISCSTG